MYSIRDICGKNGVRKENAVADGTNQLICKEEDSFQAKLSVAEVEEILKGWAKKIKNHGIVIALSAEPSDKRDADTARKGFINLGLIFKLGMFSLHGLEFNGDLFSRDDVNSQVDVTFRDGT